MRRGSIDLLKMAAMESQDVLDLTDSIRALDIVSDELMDGLDTRETFLDEEFLIKAIRYLKEAIEALTDVSGVGTEKRKLTQLGRDLSALLKGVRQDVNVWEDQKQKHERVLMSLSGQWEYLQNEIVEVEIEIEKVRGTR